jgi:hypothetical protein
MGGAVVGISWAWLLFSLRCRTVMFQSTRALWARREILHMSVLCAGLWSFIFMSCCL